MGEIEVSKVKPNKDNPRVIKDDKFKKLVESVKKFPEMLKIRPIVLNRDYVIIGGNQRFKACVEAEFKTIPFYFADELTPDQEREFMIKDNVQSGDWDFDLLEAFESKELSEWGLEIESDLMPEKEIYSRKIVSPVYEPKNEKPDIGALFNDSRARELAERIKKTKLPKNVSDFLKLAAFRHVVFDFEKIADFYAASPKEIQELFEESALVIIDFNQAIERGFVEVNERIADQYRIDYED